VSCACLLAAVAGGCNALIGLEVGELAEFIREAGVEPKGPEAEWRLAAADVLALQAERDKRASKNLAELEKLKGVVPDGG
jgi:hypothetical protein